MTGSPVARQPNLAGPTGRRWMVASTRIVLLGRECPVVWSLSVPRSLRGLVPRSGSGLPTRFEASLLGHHAASDLLRGGPLRRRPVGGGIDRESWTARLGSIASTCMFVQLAKGISQSPADVLLEEQFRTLWLASVVE